MQGYGQKKKWRMSRGARNLVMLGAAAIIIATITTGVSLIWYHGSGDIYLDRSRPGYMPDEEEVEDEEDKNEEYSFSKSGVISAEVLEEYLKKLDVEVRAIDADETPFGANVLSDAELNIPEAKE